MDKIVEIICMRMMENSEWTTAYTWSLLNLHPQKKRYSRRDS